MSASYHDVALGGGGFFTHAEVIYEGSKPPADTTATGDRTRLMRDAFDARLTFAAGYSMEEFDTSDVARFLDALPQIDLGTRPCGVILATHGGFIRRVAAELARRNVPNAGTTVPILDRARRNNLFALRLSTVHGGYVTLVRHCARLFQKQGLWGGEYTRPDPGCIVTAGGKMWGVEKLARALRRDGAVSPRMCSSVMNRAVETATAIAGAMGAEPTTIVILPFCREGGNPMDTVGLDFLNRPSGASTNYAQNAFAERPHFSGPGGAWGGG